MIFPAAMRLPVIPVSDLDSDARLPAFNLAGELCPFGVDHAGCSIYRQLDALMVPGNG